MTKQTYSYSMVPGRQAGSQNDQDKGKFLRETREAKGISLETVHEETKIPLDVLRGIEEGYKVGTLAPFYYHSFLKLYAKFLGVEIKNILPDQKDQNKEKQVKPAPMVAVTSIPVEKVKKVEQKEKRKKEFDFDGMKAWLKKRWTPQLKQQVLVGAGILLALFLVVRFVGFVIHKIKNRPKPAVVKIEPQAPKPVVQTQPVVPPALVEPTVSAKAGMTQNVTLTVRALKDGWLQVKVDGAVVFQSKLRAGSVETWKAEKEIVIAGKNLNQLEFELNGKMVGTLGQKDRKAKELIVTKQGLTVTK